VFHAVYILIDLFRHFQPVFDVGSDGTCI